jgi:hypothetical protein
VVAIARCLVLVTAESAPARAPDRDRSATGLRAELDQAKAELAEARVELVELRLELEQARAEVRTVQAVAKADIGVAIDRAEAQAAAQERVMAELREALAWHRRPSWWRVLG